MVYLAYVWCAAFLVLGSLIIVCDFRYRRVPNQLLLGGVLLQVVWLVYISAAGVGLGHWSIHWSLALVGFALGLILFYPLWRFRALGAGDVKFIAVLGFLVGPTGLFPVLLLGTVACGLHALGMVLLMGWAPARNVWRSSTVTRRGVPYAAYLALAAIAWMVWKVSEGGLRITWGG